MGLQSEGLRLSVVAQSPLRISHGSFFKKTDYVYKPVFVGMINFNVVHRDG